jgi:hypothetical protein
MPQPRAILSDRLRPLPAGGEYGVVVGVVPVKYRLAVVEDEGTVAVRKAMLL